MIEFAAVLLSIVLYAIAILHAAWGLGSRWPRGDEQSLVKAVVGRPGARRMPSPAACFVVAGLLSAVATWPLYAIGFLPEAWPRWLTLASGAGIGAVFVGRGLAGYSPAWRRMHSEQPFARLDRRYYSPLCLLIGAGFIAILIARASP